jgi:hypothetical protein
VHPMGPQTSPVVPASRHHLQRSQYIHDLFNDPSTSYWLLLARIRRNEQTTLALLSG